MKNTKPKTAVKKTTKTTKPCNEISEIWKNLLQKRNELTDITTMLLDQQQDLNILSERQQVMFYAIAVATLLGAVNFIWLCLK